MGVKYIRLSIKQAQHFLDEAESLLDMKCPDTQTDIQEHNRKVMIDILSRKVKRARWEA